MNRKSQKEIQVTTHMVRQFLQENEDTGYRDFHSNLLPGVDNVMGIRLPVLRKFAKQLSGMDWQEWFEQADDQWYEGNDASRIGECLCKDGMQRTLNICGKICAGH